MRNVVPPDLLERVGRIPQPLREDLRALVDAWYKSEQDRLTTLADEPQLRQAQGAAQALKDVSDVLKEPEAYRNVPVPVRRGPF